MKKINLLFLGISVMFLVSCSKTSTELVQSSINSYLKENLKNSSSYEPISFSKLDTLKSLTSSELEKFAKLVSEKELNDLKNDMYKISHTYSVINSDKDKVKMKITFFLNKDFKVNHTGDNNGINGDYGTLTGNAYWEYNDYIGNKADAGAEISLYYLDTINLNNIYKTTADFQGNYKFEKLLPGWYFIIVRSKNVTACPDSHLHKLEIYSSNFKELFGFDIQKYKEQLDEFNSIDSTASASLHVSSDNLTKYYLFKKQSQDKAEKLIDMLPKDFTSKIQLFTGYSNALDFSTIHIEERKTATQNTNFGITCL